MSWRGALLSALLVLAGCGPPPAPSSGAGAPQRASPASSDAATTRKLALDTMKRATTFMVERVSTRGGYVWSYLADMSRRWGEMEAYETMIWVQPPGTATVGQIFLDAYRVTGDEDYYEAAARAAEALIAGQHPSGGWNYMIDFAGEASLRRWYDTIGKNGWRLEEFHHYYGNATFDDGGTAEATRFLVRLYLERRDAKYRDAVERALQFVLSSQHESGCWPQRYPMTEEHRRGLPEFPAYLTFNDDVAAENIDVLLTYTVGLGDERAAARVRRAMDCFLLLQLPPPQAGWSLQYGADLHPAAARSYEPVGLSTKTTEHNVAELLNFYALTGERTYLEPIPAALAWLESVRMKAGSGEHDGYPALVAIGTNRPRFVHRRGSNVTNGAYFFDEDPRKPIVHTKQIRAIDVDALRARYLELSAMPADAVTRGSPLLAPPSPGKHALPRLFSGVDQPMSDMSRRSSAPAHEPSDDRRVPSEVVAKLAHDLNAVGYWPTKLERISHRYRGSGPHEVSPGDFAETEVGDAYDTSPYRTDDAPVGISTKTYIRNMSLLVRYVDGAEASVD